MKICILPPQPNGLRLAFLLLFLAFVPSLVAQLKPGQRPELFVQSGHTAVTLDVVTISEDLKLLASGGSDGQVLLWKPATGLEVRAISAHKGSLVAIALNRDGRYVASSGYDGHVVLHDTVTGGLIKDIDAGKDSGSAIALSNDGTLLAWSNGSAVELWNRKLAAPPQQIATLPGSVSTLVFKEDSSILAAGADSRISGAHHSHKTRCAKAFGRSGGKNHLYSFLTRRGTRRDWEL